jgi:hypothetical protein
VTITRLSGDQPRPGDPSAAGVEEIYVKVTGRDSGSTVDCGSCNQRHIHYALTWFEVGPGWLVAPTCPCCETLDCERIEHQILHRQQPALRTVKARLGDEAFTFWVADPDFSLERRS